MNACAEGHGAKGKSTAHVRKDPPKCVDDEGNVQDGRRDGARRVGRGDEVAENVERCVDAENGRERHDEPGMGRSRENGDDSGDHEEPENGIQKKELGIRHVPPRDVGDVRREVKRILLGDVSAVYEWEQPDPGSRRRKRDAGARTHLGERPDGFFGFNGAVDTCATIAPAHAMT